MHLIADILRIILQAAVYVVFIHVIFSILISFQILNLRQPFVAQVWSGLSQLLEPIYRPIRRWLPPTGGLDFAPMVLIILIVILQRILLEF